MVKWIALAVIAYAVAVLLIAQYVKHHARVRDE